MASPLMNAGGKLLTIAGALAMLFASSAPAAPAAPPPGPMPTTGLSGWWDASSLTWGQPVSSLTDKSTAGKNAAAGSAVAVPRLAGTLGGLYVEGSPFAYPYHYDYFHPIILDYFVAASGIAVGASQAFSVFLVWSRGNQHQVNAVYSTASVPLIDIGGTTVLSMTGRGDGTDTLTLFPNGTPVTGGTLGLRHTHSARLVFNGSTVDVWLDGVKVISAATNQATLGATADLKFLNAAQCVFHEAAAWGHALSADEHTALTAYATRWPLGPRRAINGIAAGQSNLAYFCSSAANFYASKHVAYLTGCISANLMLSEGDGATGQLKAGSTLYSGQGLFDGSNSKFLDNSGGGDPSTWPLGANGQKFMVTLDGMTADQRANLCYVAWFWSESDSASITYATKGTYTTAMKRAFALIRAHLFPGDSSAAAKLPVMVINALPFGGFDIGCQLHREMMADIASDATQNVHFMLAQSGDAIGEGDAWNSATGVESGNGNQAHRDGTGEVLYGRRMGIPIARAALSALAAQGMPAARGAPDLVTTIDPSIPQGLGPSIASAHYEGTTYAATGSVLVTVAHDKGTDLKLPLRAVLGVGWALMDGVSDTQSGNLGTPGTLIKATACARVSATQLRVTLTSPPAHPAKAQMYYNYGSGLDANNYAIIGQGNAVTDNFASVTLPPGWQIGADMGSAEQFDNALQATTYGIALS